MSDSIDYSRGDGVTVCTQCGREIESVAVCCPYCGPYCNRSAELGPWDGYDLDLDEYGDDSDSQFDRQCD